MNVLHTTGVCGYVLGQTLCSTIIDRAPERDFAILNSHLDSPRHRSLDGLRGALTRPPECADRNAGSLSAYPDKAPDALGQRFFTASPICRYLVCLPVLIVPAALVALGRTVALGFMAELATAAPGAALPFQVAILPLSVFQGSLEPSRVATTTVTSGGATAGVLSVYAVYHDQSKLEMAVDRLKEAGFNGNDISVVFPDQGRSEQFAMERNTKAPEGAATGGGTGMVVGGVLGWLAGTLAIPGIGPCEFSHLSPHQTD